MPVGVTTKKNTIPITIGAIKFPRKIPNLNQTLFSGASIFEFNIPRIRKITDNIKDQILISFSLNIGHKEITKNTTKNTNPKLLFELISIFLCFNLN